MTSKVPPSKRNKISHAVDGDEEGDTEEYFDGIVVKNEDVEACKLETSTHRNVFDLEFLMTLRQRMHPCFVPGSLWIRQEMIDMMKELQENQDSEQYKRQVLVGSPGVGKSVLFFLFALVYAMDHPAKKVMYWRKATGDGDMLDMRLFCIQALDDEQVSIRWNKPLIPFKSNIDTIYITWMRAAYPDLFKNVNDQDPILFPGHITKLRRDQITIFIDGPTHADTTDTLSGTFDFLCSSGGYPRPHNDQNTNFELSVLCGWEKDPFVGCIKHYATIERVNAIWNEQIAAERDTDLEVEAKKDAVADLIYYYTGGRIRDGLKLLEGAAKKKNQGSKEEQTADTTDICMEGIDSIVEPTADADATITGTGGIDFKKFKSIAKGIVAGISAGAVDLAANGQYGTKEARSLDSLRTYFKIEAQNQSPEEYIQVVDSEYYLKLLDDRDMTEKYLNAYKEAVKLNDMTVAGQQFERMMHKVYMKLSAENGDVPFNGHIQADGNTKEGVQQIKKGKYWMPSVPNFPGIDAAVWTDDDDFYNVQYFAGKRHGFNARQFKTTFLNHIPGSVGNNAHTSGKCFVTFVKPSDQNGTPVAISAYHYREVVIDVTTLQTVMESAPRAFWADGTLGGVEFTAPTSTLAL